MKIKLILALLLVAFMASFAKDHYHKQAKEKGYILERENEIRVQQPSPHDAPGVTTAYPYFSKVDDYKIVFRKRTLGKGSAIGYHFQEWDEVY